MGKKHLFPSIELPAPIALTDSDVYLIKRKREMIHRLDTFFRRDGPRISMTTDMTNLDHVSITVPADIGKEDVFIPKELEANVTQVHLDALNSAYAVPVLAPKAWDKTISLLEKHELKNGDKEEVHEVRILNMNMEMMMILMFCKIAFGR